MVKAAMAFVALVCGFFLSPAFAGAALFPAPLHITRQVYNSISDKTALVEEYGYGNPLVAVRGARTSIADYEKGELIEIDRDAGTYSITRFDALAKAQKTVNPARTAAGSADRPVHALRSAGVKSTKSGRSAEFFEADLDREEDQHRRRPHHASQRRVRGAPRAPSCRSTASPSARGANAHSARDSSARPSYLRASTIQASRRSIHSKRFPVGI